MIRVLFRDSGEIWELYEGDRLDKHRVDLAIDDAKWFRKYFPEQCSSCSMIVIESDGFIVGFISVSEYFIGYTKVYENDDMVDYERRFSYYGTEYILNC